MKKLVSIILHIKSFGGLIFAASLLIFSAITWFCGGDSVTISTIFQFAALSLFIAAWQFVSFSDVIIKRMKFPLRFLLFTVPFYVAFMLMARIFGWFPLETVGQWVIYTGTFFAVEVLISIIYTIFSNAANKKWTVKLEDYKNNLPK